MTFSHAYYQLTNEEKIVFLTEKLKFDKSRICKRAYYLIHSKCLSQPEAMMQCWKEAKEYRAKIKQQLEYLNDSIKHPYTSATSEQHDTFMRGVVAERNGMTTKQRNNSLTLD